MVGRLGRGHGHVQHQHPDPLRPRDHQAGQQPRLLHHEVWAELPQGNSIIISACGDLLTRIVSQNFFLVLLNFVINT